MAEQQFVFDDSQKKKESAVSGIGKFIWNSETKEFCGRDGASWGKVSLFYAVFYFCLGSFFVGMLAVFVQLMPLDKPTYYGESSTMNARGINPGLGFRPQIDPEDSLIQFSPKQKEGEFGFDKYVKNLQNFLDSKYKKPEGDKLKACVNDLDYSKEFETGTTCTFDYETIFAKTSCKKEDGYGFQTNSPCILIKLNKIISWTPKLKSNESEVVIRCEGETSADKDNIISVKYHSEGLLNDDKNGVLNKKYFPFMGQKQYRAPFVFAQFDVTPNTLVNVECKAYAENIDNSDRLNRRGLTKFGIFVSTK